MSMQPKLLEGLRVPLFDRLVDSAPEVSQELTPLRLYGRDAVFASIARDLHRLLNTRRSTPGLLRLTDATVLDFGIPDFAHLSTSGDLDSRALAEMVRQAVQIFEPRLADITVTFTPNIQDPRQFLGTIACKVRLGTHPEPVTFPLVLQNREQSVEVLLPAPKPATVPNPTSSRPGSPRG